MRVSVVVPAFNHASFVAEALDSVLGGDFADLEVILVDDGSTDDTLERVEPFRRDPRMRVVSQENRGAHAAINRGLELASGEVLFVLNSDDSFCPGRVARLVERLDADPGVAFACSWIELVDESNTPMGVKRGPLSLLPPWAPRRGPRLSDTPDLSLALLETNFVSTTSNLAFRRELVSHGLRFLPLRYCHDWAFLLEACRHGRPELIPEPLVRYRVHGANTIREGQERGEGLMRFEILWVVARHALQLCRLAAARGADPNDLTQRRARSLPRFGPDAILDQLLLLRGEGDAPPPAYEALLDPDHPFRRAAILALASTT